MSSNNMKFGFKKEKSTWHSEDNDNTIIMRITILFNDEGN